MSHFIGTLLGKSDTLSTRCGSAKSGLVAHAASWKGAIRIDLEHDEDTGEDRFTVTQVPWRAVGCIEVLAKGTLGVPSSPPCT